MQCPESLSFHIIGTIGESILIDTLLELVDIEFSKYACESDGFIHFLWFDTRHELLESRSHLAQLQMETQACILNLRR